MQFLLTLIVLFLNVQPVFGQPAVTCAENGCVAGTYISTYTDKSTPFYECPTREVSDYITLVTSMLRLQAAMGVMPNISPVTGEPEYTGESKAILDKYRIKAGIKTFDQAIGMCQKGKSGTKATVMNYQKDGLSIWVSPRRSGSQPFWMPVASAIPIR
ncbi:hypothetical protein [Ferriphaselus sp. R-1]|uniref:hypothetical protein n=1 Tax=Ferriphaselus sp. R-1 TaxID=1485544 RepID=UPI0012687E6B|nr:hypothetical protein [Ferriphaselus sp. R-1]